jgi:hypothetical protein
VVQVVVRQSVPPASGNVKVRLAVSAVVSKRAKLPDMASAISTFWPEAGRSEIEPVVNTVMPLPALLFKSRLLPDPDCTKRLADVWPVMVGVIIPPEKLSAVEVAFEGKGYAKVAGVPVSCEYGSERLGNVVMLATLVVAARSMTKRASDRAFVK